jgi:LysM repeat protein
MKHKRSSRNLIMILLILIFVFGLTSCKLPASQGPESASATSQGFPVPGETQGTTDGNNVNTSATQTAQAIPPVVITQVPPAQTQNPIQPYPAPTNVPGATEVTATQASYVQPTPGSPPASYTLVEGEHAFCIARRFNVNQTELLNLNNLTPTSIVYAGQVLQIPQTGNPFDGTRALLDHPTTYKILEGDTLNIIACKFGDVSPDMIALQNNLSTTDLPPGEVLVIP